MNELINNKKKSEVLAEAIAKKGFGDVITHSEIEELIQEKYGTSKYQSEISRAKKILLKRYHRSIESVRGDGYRLIMPDDYAKQSLGFYKKGFRSMQRGVDVLENAPIKDMSADGYAAHRRVQDRTTILIASMKGAQTELIELSKSKSYFDPDLIGRK